MTGHRRWRTLREVVVGGLQALFTVVTSPLSRRWYNRWGATDEELTRPMPGDDLVKAPKLGYTRAITIEAPPEQVWPWLAQIGQGRGGFYSFDGLENLIGCDIHSTDQILPDHQHLAAGDVVRSGQDQHICWVVMDLDRASCTRHARSRHPRRCRGTRRGRRRAGQGIRRLHLAMGPRTRRRRPPNPHRRPSALHLQSPPGPVVAHRRASQLRHGAPDAARTQSPR